MIIWISHLRTGYRFDSLFDVTCLNSLYVEVIYRHPKKSYADFQEKLAEVIQYLNQSNSPFFLVGNYNIEISNQNLYGKVEKYLNEIYSAGR